MIFIFMLFDYVKIPFADMTFNDRDQLNHLDYLLACFFDGAVFHVLRHRKDHILMLQA
jgi:hypothetical protein